jgi:hypothetical protein
LSAAIQVPSTSREMTRLIGKDCLFCGNRPVTKEHIWPDWIVREFKPFTKRTDKKVTGVNRTGIFGERVS